MGYLDMFRDLVVLMIGVPFYLVVWYVMLVQIYWLCAIMIDWVARVAMVRHKDRSALWP